METKLTEKFKARMADWLWSSPMDIPFTDPEYAEWIKPAGKPLKNKRWHLYRSSRGGKAVAPKRVDEFYHRGGYERHEVRARHTPKAVMPFRGKGSKVERRRQGRRRK